MKNDDRRASKLMVKSEMIDTLTKDFRSKLLKSNKIPKSFSSSQKDYKCGHSVTQSEKKQPQCSR